MYNRFLLAFGVCFLFGPTHAQVPDWQYIAGPDGGSIENFDLDGSSLYALSRTGIYQSEDEGYHWQLLLKSLATTHDKQQLRVEKGIFYAFDADGSLVRSTDQGESWKPVLQKPFPLDFETEQLQQLFVKGDTILVGSRFTIYRSANRGETWTATADLAPASFISIFEFKNELFAAQDRYIYRSSDAGMHWETVFTNAVGYAAVVATDSFLLAFYAPKNRLIRSIDGLRTWDAIETDTIKKHLYEEDNRPQWVGGNGDNIYFFQRMGYLLSCPIRFCHSSDGGLTWRRGNEGKNASIGWSLKTGIMIDNHLILASDQLQHSTNGADSFFEAQTGLKTAAIRQIIHHGSAVFSNTNWARAHISRNEGESWSTYPRPALGEESCYTRAGLRETQEKVVRFQDPPVERYYSLDNGTTWTYFETPYYQYEFETNQALWSADYTLLNGNLTYQVWKLADGDTTFTPVLFLDMGADYLVDQVVGLGDRFAVVLLGKYLIFNENGTKIQELPTSSCLAPFGWNGNLYFANNTYYNFCNDRCFIFPPNASEWQEIYPQDWTKGVPLYHSNRMFFESHKGIIWVGLEGKGLFYATDNTGRFYPVQPQMPYPFPTAISFHENQVWVGTDGGGIWTYPLPTEVSDPSQSPVFQAFPNPSLGELNLQSDRFLKEEIAFALLDAAGRRISKQVLTPGQYWYLNFPNLPKGVYFLQLRTTSEVFGLKWVVGN